jgi:hypothetical protein
LAQFCKEDLKYLAKDELERLAKGNEVALPTSNTSKSSTKNKDARRVKPVPVKAKEFDSEPIAVIPELDVRGSSSSQSSSTNKVSNDFKTEIRMLKEKNQRKKEDAFRSSAFKCEDCSKFYCPKSSWYDG